MRKTITDLINETNLLEPWEASMRRDIRLREKRARHAAQGFRVVRGRILPLEGYQLPPEETEAPCEVVFTDLTQEQRHALKLIPEEIGDE